MPNSAPADPDSASAEGPPSFEDLYSAYAGDVHRYCLSQVGHFQAAEDLTHATFAKALPAYELAAPSSDGVKTWLFTIARNSCKDYHRRNGRWYRFLRLAHNTEKTVDVELVVADRVELLRISKAVSQLSQRDRQLIGLRVAADLSYKEIGEAIGISEQVAKVSAHRALKRLRGVLNEEQTR